MRSVYLGLDPGASGAISAREKARAAGLKRYSTGEPCPHGHTTERYISDGRCLECEREKSLRYAAAHREERRAYSLQYAKNHREQQRARALKYAQEHKDERREYNRQLNRKNPGRHRDYLRRKAEHLAGSARPEVCEVCGGHSDGRAIHRDHDHTSGGFRGWLCSNCNTILGLAGDSPERLRSLAAYLDRTRVGMVA